MKKIACNWLIPLFVIGVPVFCLLLTLSWWQYNRGADKEDIIEQIASLDDQWLETNAVPMVIDESLDLRILPIAPEAISNNYIFLDNKIRNSVSGVELIRPVSFGSNWLLVNFGWLPWMRNKNLPHVEQDLDSLQNLHGRLRVWQQSQFHLSEQDYKNDLPKIVQWLDYWALAQYFDFKLLPYILYIDENHNQALSTNWSFTGNVSPVKHYGYALQWLAMAIALAFFLLYCVYHKYSPKIRTRQKNEAQ